MTELEPNPVPREEFDRIGEILEESYYYDELFKATGVGEFGVKSDELALKYAKEFEDLTGIPFEDIDWEE